MLPHDFFKLMSDETRIRILLWIHTYESVSVNSIAAALNESQPKISRHLATLRQAGVIRDNRQGQKVFYSLANELPGWLYRTLQGLQQSNCLQSAYQLNLNQAVSS